MEKRMAETLVCSKCKGAMVRKGSMLSGNFKYDEFVCKGCGNKKTMAVEQNRLSGI